MKNKSILPVFLFLLLASCDHFPRKTGQAASFRSDWPTQADRIWIGPSYWANRLADWRLRKGRVECVYAGKNRNLHLLTFDLDGKGSVNIQARLGYPASFPAARRKGWIGFLFGAKGIFHDYRENAVRGKGWFAGITPAGGLVLAGPSLRVLARTRPSGTPRDALLRLELTPAQKGFLARLFRVDPASGKVMETLEAALPSGDFSGNLGLSCHLPGRAHRQGDVCAWFADWTASGAGLVHHPERAFGPVLFAQYTLSRGTLKLTAQMPPLGKKEYPFVILETLSRDGKWKEAGRAVIDPMARTARFRVTGWDSSRATPYRLSYDLLSRGNRRRRFFYQGAIAGEPDGTRPFVLAAFTGNGDMGFPNTEVLEHVKAQHPDFLFFSGDQIYEGSGDYGCQRKPLDIAVLEYLRKWYLYGWAFGPIIKNRPTVSIPDDHDVFNSNIWGCGGKAVDPRGDNAARQDSGGYNMPAAFVNMVQRTQTSHLPDPYDPTPVKQGITVYYCPILYGGVSFAVLEDRKFKSAPKPLLPKADIWNGWPHNMKFNAAKEADVPGARLLGKRQLDFLEHWAADWSGGAWMKVVLSQTIFCNIATLPASARDDNVVPRMKIPKPGEYIHGDRIATDFDSDGWPQTGRNEAIRRMRKAFAFHVAGDQHLGTTIQYGVENWRDSCYAMCVPSIGNIWPRRWFPPVPGRNRAPGAPPYTGDFLDGFGNKVTVYAVANPRQVDLKPARLYNRATGYGIARMYKDTRVVSLEIWPRWVDPAAEEAGPYYGWPVVFHQLDDYARKAAAWLPEVRVEGMRDPVIQVIDEKTGEIVYTLRIQGTRFRPKVFAPGLYTLRVGDQGPRGMRIFTHIRSLPSPGGKPMVVKF